MPAKRKRLWIVAPVNTWPHRIDSPQPTAVRVAERNTNQLIAHFQFGSGVGRTRAQALEDARACVRDHNRVIREMVAKIKATKTLNQRKKQDDAQAAYPIDPAYLG